MGSAHTSRPAATGTSCDRWSCTTTRTASFGYTAGAEESLDRARAQDWTVVSMKSDWSTVFAEAPAR